MSAATPVPMPAPRSPFLHLVTDPWIAISWLLLISTGLISVLMLLQHPKPPSTFNVIGSFLGTATSSGPRISDWLRAGALRSAS